MKIETKTSFDKMFAKLQKRDKEAVGRAIDKFIQNPAKVICEKTHELQSKDDITCMVIKL